MWISESKIWQPVRSGIKNLQSVSIRIRTSHRVNFQFQLLSTWQISNPKVLILSDFESKYSQRVSCWIKMFMCQISNQKVNNVSDLEPNSYKKICQILIGNFYNACDFLNQKLYNVSDSVAKMHNASHFESNASQFFFYFISENVQSFWLWKESFKKILHFNQTFYNVSDLEIKNFKTCQNWNQSLCIVSDIESKNSQPVRFIFKIFTTCRTLYQNFYNASVPQLNIYNVSRFESRFLQHVRFWMILLQHLRFRFKILRRVRKKSKLFTTCQNLGERFHNDARFWVKKIRTCHTL